VFLSCARVLLIREFDGDLVGSITFLGTSRLFVRLVRWLVMQNEKDEMHKSKLPKMLKHLKLGKLRLCELLNY
jgi:hypothetical protein